MATILPSTPLILFPYVRKEALLSSQIEATQSSLSDLLLFENDEATTVELDDVTEVSSYVAAGKQRGRIYAYSDYLALMDRGTEPLPP
jgi:hypothetical protein